MIDVLHLVSEQIKNNDKSFHTKQMVFTIPCSIPASWLVTMAEW